ncbi:site-specific DNA-methyltransferase [Streptococcus parasanguinis]|uniref:site-specific DNA-methyltransferase n=1 Tax=Streptococcus parasanguinis TaxID=1318 RepID=UPI00066A353C|nr:site-specific DNA-methyltransferase [Streptococcus parasanguinis]
MKKELEELLSQHGNFFVEGVLNKNKLAELARRYDPELLNVLMGDEKVASHFFSTLETGIQIFKKDVFLQFLNNKEFLPDSFTAYKTKIGLANENGHYLSEDKNVVLNFPYKDCVLEGGQTKEDAKRQEIFFNETLAPSEINRLLDDKVLTNFKRFDKDGEHDVEELKDTDNLIIKGNNLIALHSLKKRFAGKVKLIYIDVPYNTGNDGFRYNDSFNHSTWLTFIKNRLEIAKELLSKEGIIFIHLDDNEVKYLGVLLDEIFGQDNFVELITVVNNPRGRDYGGIANMHEFIFVYKQPYAELNLINDPEKKFQFEDQYGGFDIRELRNRNTAFHIGNRPNLVYPIFVDPESKDDSGFYRVSEVKTDKFSVEVMPKKSRGIQTVWRWGKPKFIENKNINVMAKAMKDGGWSIQEKYRKSSTMARSVWWDKEVNSERGTIHLRELFGDKVFMFPKPEGTIKRIIEISTSENDIVLDFFLGSGTTAAVAHKMNRQYIGIEQMDYIETVSVERMKKVINGEQGGISKDVKWQGGGSFVYCELKNDAQEFKNAIVDATSTDQLLTLFEQAKKSSFLSYRVDPKKLRKQDFEKLSLAEQKQILSEIIDNNNLYVNYSDIDDRDYQVSEQDKKLNRSFYGEEN